MKTYRHTQPATTILTALGVLFLLAAATSIVLHAMLLGAAILAVTGWVFRSMTVEITETDLVWYFGSGFPRGRKPLSEIASAEPFRINWLYGWGIHYGPRGWLYNVSGFGAVAIKLKNGKQFCLGSDEPEELARQLNKSA
jgi:hypothetical protein